MAKKKASGKAAKKTVRKAKAKRPAVKKRAAKKRVVKKAPKAKTPAPVINGIALQKIGEITHYFPHVNAAAVKLMKSGLKVGDEIYLKGHTSDFKEKVESLQLDHVPIREGKKGQEIGLQVKSRVRIGDSVYKI